MSPHNPYTTRDMPDGQPRADAQWCVVHVPSGRLAYQRIPQREAETIAAQMTARGQDGPWVARQMDDRTEPSPITTANNLGWELRDWFAGQALAGIAANSDARLSAEEYAHDAYAIADAMLAARKAGRG